MSILPEDICHDILVRLPVRSLLACKCVCKNWYALISTSDFVKTHIAIHQNQNPKLMLQGEYGKQLYSISCDSLESLCKIEDDDVVKLDYPFKSSVEFGQFGLELLGSSNGLVCIRLYGYASDSDIFCLWNPATREYKEIPESSVESGNWSLRCFGYDHKTDDYKFIFGVAPDETDDITLVEVYTLSSNSWKPEITIHYWFSDTQSDGLLFNGDFHWLAIARNGLLLLLSLNISNETFKEMQLPNELLDKNKLWTSSLGVLEGSIFVLTSFFADGVPIHFDVWKMLDYGVQESWTKRYVIAHEGIVSRRNPSYFRLLMSFENGEILFMNSCGLVLYDPKNGSTRDLRIDNLQFYKAVKYFESLVSLNSGTYVEGKKSTERSTET